MSIEIDDSDFIASLNNIKLDTSDMIGLAMAGSAVVKATQKTLVPVDSGATKISIKDHFVVKTEKKIEDDIGPETEYAPYIERGIVTKPNYPIQPFVVPSATGNSKSRTLTAINNAFGIFLEKKWPI